MTGYIKYCCIGYGLKDWGINCLLFTSKTLAYARLKLWCLRLRGKTNQYKNVILFRRNWDGTTIIKRINNVKQWTPNKKTSN